MILNLSTTTTLTTTVNYIDVEFNPVAELCNRECVLRVHSCIIYEPSTTNTKYYLVRANFTQPQSQDLTTQSFNNVIYMKTVGSDAPIAGPPVKTYISAGNQIVRFTVDGITTSSGNAHLHLLMSLEPF